MCQSNSFCSLNQKPLDIYFTNFTPTNPNINKIQAQSKQLSLINEENYFYGLSRVLLFSSLFISSDTLFCWMSVLEVNDISPYLGVIIRRYVNHRY